MGQWLSGWEEKPRDLGVQTLAICRPKKVGAGDKGIYYKWF
jgi:hypothetical protein